MYQHPTQKGDNPSSHFMLQKLISASSIGVFGLIVTLTLCYCRWCWLARNLKLLWRFVQGRWHFGHTKYSCGFNLLRNQLLVTNNFKRCFRSTFRSALWSTWFLFFTRNPCNQLENLFDVKRQVDSLSVTVLHFVSVLTSKRFTIFLRRLRMSHLVQKE